MEMLRERIKGLEKKIVEMIRNGQDNSAIAERLHRWTRALMITTNPAELPEVLVRELKQQFLIPQAGIRVWGVAEAFKAMAFAQGASADAHARIIVARIRLTIADLHPRAFRRQRASLRAC